MKDIVIKLRNEGKKFKEIASILNITVSSAMHLYKYKAKVHKRKTGPRCQIGKRKSLIIKRFINKSKFSGKKTTCNKILNETGVDVSRRTLNNWLLKNEYRYTKVAQKIYLTEKHKSTRTLIVSKWLEENVAWERTVFSDEKRFCLDGPDNW